MQWRNICNMNLVDWHNLKYGTTLGLADNYSEDLNVWGTNSIEEAIKRVQKFFAQRHFYDAKPFQQAQKALKNLKKDYNLVVITARDVIVEKETLAWVEKHFPEVFAVIESCIWHSSFNLGGLCGK